MSTFNYYIPTRMLFGAGQLNNLHKQALPGKKALIVISSGKSMRANGYLDRVIEQLKLAGVEYEIFDKILPNPVKTHVMEGAEFARTTGCDFVIGLGGGSSIDASKAIAVMTTNTGDYWDYMMDGSGGRKPVENAPLPIVAITTTAGTGTEADPWTVTTNEELNEKIGFGFDGTFPTLSIIDPELMTTVPPHLTAYQGFDALFHSTEGYINTTAYEISDICALEAIRLIGQYLPTAVRDGNDIVAREKVALANTLAGMVETLSGCTSEHAMAHTMSAFVPAFTHGAALICISEAYYTHFAKNHACDDRLIAMAKALGKTDAACAMDFVEALVDLQKACGVDNIKMSDFGIKKEDLRAYAKNAQFATGNMFGNDWITLSEDDCVAIYEAAYK